MFTRADVHDCLMNIPAGKLLTSLLLEQVADDDDDLDDLLSV